LIPTSESLRIFLMVLRIRRADYLIHNYGEALLIPQVLGLHQELLKGSG
jgi:hypothetical protein